MDELITAPPTTKKLQWRHVVVRKTAHIKARQQ